MIGLIHRREGGRAAASLPIAGRPLLVRQIQYLRALGAERVVVEHSAGASLEEVRSWTSDEALTTGVTLLATTTPLGATEVAERAGIDHDEVLVAFADDALFDADVRAAVSKVAPGKTLRLVPAVPPGTKGIEPASLLVRGAGGNFGEVSTSSTAGWGGTIASLADALELGVAALDHRLPGKVEGHVWTIQVHASEDSPGVWSARGARIEAGAVVRPPVLLGEGALVRSGAFVGPRAILGAGVVVERDATVTESMIGAGTVVGEGIRLERTGADPAGLLDLATGEHFEIDDPAILGHRGSGLAVGALPRVGALALVLLLALPALLRAMVEVTRGRPLVARVRWRSGARTTSLLDGADERSALGLWLRLIDVMIGRRTLVGVGRAALGGGASVSPGLLADAERAARGALIIDDALCGLAPTDEGQLRAVAWYAVGKSWRVDADLLARQLRGPIPVGVRS